MTAGRKPRRTGSSPRRRSAPRRGPRSRPRRLLRAARWLLIACVAFVALLGVEAVIAIQTVPDDDYRPPSSAPRTFTAAGAAAPGAAARTLRFVVLGDSTATGRGASYERGIAVGSARHLARLRRVTLRNLGVSGARLGDVRREQLTAAAYRAPDVVLIAAGANDVTGLTRLDSVRKDLDAIADRLRDARCDVAIVVTGSGDVGAVPRLAQPLRTVAGWRTKQVNGAIEDVARERGLVFAPLAKRTGRRFRADRSLFAADGFHPSAAGYGAWMGVIEAALDRAQRRRQTSGACPSQAQR